MAAFLGTSDNKVTDRRSSEKQAVEEDVGVVGLQGEILNASGHRDQLQRGYGTFSIIGLALSVDNAWVAVGTSLNVAICELYSLNWGTVRY